MATGNCATGYKADWLVVGEYTIPRSTDFTLTTAPATAEPLLSTTVPVTVAVTSCAITACAPLKASAKTTTTPKTTRKLFFISCSPKWLLSNTPQPFFQSDSR